MELGRHIELSATSFTEADRVAVLIAFREHVPIIVFNENGDEFARMVPDEELEADEDDDSTGE